MALTLCTDLAAADWITGSELEWSRLVGFGPGGFEASARLRILPDPTHPGQSENDVEPEDWRHGQLARLFTVLAEHTTTPDDCSFCVWDGYDSSLVTGDDDDVSIDTADDAARLGRPDAVPGVAPLPARVSTTPEPVKVVVPHRAYWLFRGPLADVGRWRAAHGWPGEPRLSDAEPAFVWPADHAWCVAKDVDPHWAGIGGTAALVSRLVAAPLLDVVPADPDEPPPAYG
ncbi:MAG TPA: hypothetical protein VI452_06695 [Marmoricola sp.]